MHSAKMFFYFLCAMALKAPCNPIDFSTFAPLMSESASSTSVLFNRFQQSIVGIGLPEKFTFPFYYEPHRLCVIAAEELQELIKVTNWKRNFGLDPKKPGNGKMFGVLVVQNKAGELGYLSAFSGQLKNAPDCFVPNVYQLTGCDNYYTRGTHHIDGLTQAIKVAKHLPERASAKKELQNTKQKSEEFIASLREKMRLAKADRKAERAIGETTLSASEYAALISEMANESRHQRYILRNETTECNERVARAQQKVDAFEKRITELTEERANYSNRLQKRLFENYRFLNQSGDEKTLLDIFHESVPPSGAGDCAAPKLLQYAFANKLKPVAMAEFWWGASPTTTIRHHKKYYPACSGKCKPILGHMLAGMELDTHPMILEHGQNKQLETVFEDEHIIVINKPFGLLSVPGKEIEDSVLTRIRAKFPDASGPLLVHRLDMDTSGLILVAKSAEVHKKLQAQFLKRTVKKRYVALLEGECSKKKGTITLPLRPDIDDRPNQMVCFEHGKRAITRFEIVEVIDGRSRVNFFPHTGRTHQLRIHAAHPLGLNCPIVGDVLYGEDSDRMYLQAEMLEFEHPISKKRMVLKVDTDF